MEESDYQQSRAYQLTINNPIDYGFDHENIKLALNSMSLTYWCMCDETGLKNGTYHTHIYFRSKGGIRFKTVKNKFPTAHIENALGTTKENRDYIRKEGKWKDTVKEETNHIETFEEWGEAPSETEEKNPDKAELMKLIVEGKTNYEIVHLLPKYALKTKDIDVLRTVLLTDKFKEQNRRIEVIYLYGKAGTNKTRSIYKKHGAKNICRITYYPKNGDVKFDAYTCEDVLVFEEFHSQIPIEAMLNYLDIYPTKLPARFYDHVACYSKVYITSNVDFDAQYLDVQEDNPEQWNAFKRRVHKIIEFCDDGKTIIHKNEDPKELIDDNQ